MADNNAVPFQIPNSPKFGHGQSVYKRSLLRDSLMVEEVVFKAITAEKVRAIDLSSLVRSFCSLVPLIRALQGKTLVLSGTFSADRDPIALAKRIRQMSQKQRLSARIIDMPQSFVDEPTLKEEKVEAKAKVEESKPKGIS